MKHKLSSAEISKEMNISPARGMEAVIKAQLISAILKAVERRKLTLIDLDRRLAPPRSGLTGSPAVRI